MKKIRSKQQLEDEKKRMQKEIVQLEEKIRSKWQELKQSLQPSALAKTALNKVIKNQTENTINGEESILKSTFTYGVSLLAKKLADKTEEKIDRIFKKE
jgi:Skp family chaperone for outer membrane proteins